MQLVHAAFRQNLGDVLVANGYRRYQRTHRTITSPGYWRPLNGLVGVIGMSLYGSRTASSAVRNGNIDGQSLSTPANENERWQTQSFRMESGLERTAQLGNGA